MRSAQGPSSPTPTFARTGPLIFVSPRGCNYGGNILPVMEIVARYVEGHDCGRLASVGSMCPPRPEALRDVVWLFLQRYSIDLLFKFGIANLGYAWIFVAPFPNAMMHGNSFRQCLRFSFLQSINCIYACCRRMQSRHLCMPHWLEGCILSSFRSSARKQWVWPGFTSWLLNPAIDLGRICNLW